jgi:hypothetical protein
VPGWFSTWQEVLGFLLLANLTLGGIAALAFLKGKLGEILSWAATVFALGMSLTAGFYAKDTWIADVIGWVMGWHPVVQLFFGFVILGLVAWLVQGALPNQLVGFALTAGLVYLAFFAPIAVQYAPGGDVGDLARTIVNEATAVPVQQTRSWFQ